MKKYIYRLIIRLFFLTKQFIGRGTLIYLMKKFIPKISSISLNNKFLVYSSYNNYVMKYLVDGNNYIENKLIEDGIHSEYIIREIINNFSANSIIIDVGANIGTIAIPIAKITKNKGVDIIACEASNYIFTKLEENVSLNNLDNIILVNKAIYNVKKSITIFEQQSDSINQGLSSIYKNQDIGKYNEIEVEAIPLDDLIQEYNLTKPISIIKIDVQGPEYEVIMGADLIIKKFKPIIIFEYEDEYQTNPRERKENIESLLNDHGYKIFMINQRMDNIRPAILFDKYLNTNLIAVPFDKL